MRALFWHCNLLIPDGFGGPGEVRTLDLMTARNPSIFYTFHPFPCFPWPYTNSGHLLSLKRRSPFVSISSTFGTLLEHPPPTEWNADSEAFPSLEPSGKWKVRLLILTQGAARCAEAADATRESKDHGGDLRDRIRGSG